MLVRYKGELETDDGISTGMHHGEFLADVLDLLAGKARNLEKVNRNVTGVTIWFGDAIISQGPVRRRP
jgi:hypothetical protein